MLSLGIHTASIPWGLALSGEVERSLRHEGPTEDLLMVLERLLEGRPLSQVTGVGVTIGPGGYTAIRSGVEVAKTLAQLHGWPVVPIDVAEALRFQAAGQRLAIALDIRRGELYGGVVSGQWEVPLEVRERADWEAIVAQMPPMPVWGHAALTPLTVARLAHLALQHGEGVSFREVSPLYLRPAVP